MINSEQKSKNSLFKGYLNYQNENKYERGLFVLDGCKLYR